MDDDDDDDAPSLPSFARLPLAHCGAHGTFEVVALNTKFKKWLFSSLSIVTSHMFHVCLVRLYFIRVDDALFTFGEMY